MSDLLRADTQRCLAALPEHWPSRRPFLDLLQDPTATDFDRPGAHITASTVVVDAELSRVLLCLHGRMRKWVQLGGHCEPSDVDLVGAALREATEECGIVGIRMHPVPIDLDIHPVDCRYGRCLHYDVRFAGLAPRDTEPVVSSESTMVAWCDPADLPTPLATATERLVAPALAAARTLYAPA